MKYWTYLEIKTKINRDMATEQEEFVKPSELLDYVNEGIDEAEAEIHTIYEDYFLRKDTIDLVAGTKLYSLPTDIYANKIRGIIYKENTLVYPLQRIRFRDQFLDQVITDNFSTSANYRYMLLNTDASTKTQIEVSPSPRTSITGGLTIFYLRNANRLAADTDICDIPEFVSFVIQFAKMRIYEKESHPNYQVAIQREAQQRQQMVSTLTNMVIDNDTEIEKDLSFYEDMHLDTIWS